MTDPSQLPPAAVLVSHSVADFGTWKKGFDDNESVRRDEAAALGHHINRADDDPNMVTIFMATSDLDKARAFTASDDLREIMQEVGVTGPPEFTWVTPRREDVIWDRELPAFLLSHRVADFDKWLEGYDGADDLRKSKGIIGHAANQSIDAPSLAVVYHQAESFDDLRAFLADPELKTIMEDAGVTSEPEVTFHTGGHGKQYA
jgi:hypothetical protein